MKKKTAKYLSVILVISYLVLIFSGVILWQSSRYDKASQSALSEANASDNADFGDYEEGNIREEENEKEEGNIGESNDTVIEEVKEQTKEDVDAPIRMVFTGDVYIGNYVSSVYDANGVNGILSEFLLEQFQTANLVMVNQEFPFSTRGEAMANKQYTFRVDPDKVQLFTQMGIDIVSMANNHTLDYGTDALLDSMDTLEQAGITYVGVGRNLAEAKTTRYIEINGKSIAILSASRVIPVSEWGATTTKPGLFTTYDPTALIEEIKVAREQADVVIVYLHWGLERKEYPETYQRTMGKQFIDAGADVVIGSHPHVLQGFEYYKGKLIAYSLGNFIFSQTINQTAVLTVTLKEENQFEFTIIPCSTVNGKTSELTDQAQITQVYEYLSSISEGAWIEEDGTILQK